VVRVGVRFQLQGDTQAFLLVRLVGQVEELRQLAGGDNLADLALEAPLVDAVRNRGDDESR
jgi:hypothetical protein